MFELLTFALFALLTAGPVTAVRQADRELKDAKAEIAVLKTELGK